MEINPYDARLRMLQQLDGVQQQREAAPDAETAGCPGCPYFWTCPVPHRGEEVRAPEEIELEDVRGQLGDRGGFRPHDESDVGWTDRWIEEDLPAADGGLPQNPAEGSPVEDSSPAADEASAGPPRGHRRSGRRLGLFRRRG